MNTGKVIIFSAPSGAGKTTIAKAILKQNPLIEFSISACSRDKRPGEQHGVDYYFLTPQEFKSKIDQEELLEWQEVYPGSYYGTLKSEVDRIWAKGHHIMFDVDTLGGLNIKSIYGEKALAIFIQPPSVESLEERLRARNTETEESLAKRMYRADFELQKASSFDVIIVNSDLETAIRQTADAINDFISK